MNMLKGWRTIIINAFASIVPILQLTEFKAILPPHWMPWYMLAVVLANMYLRSITTSPVGKK